ncbi:Mce protein [Mycobacterium sp. 852002-40037_SCH5390672]|uniref:Mce protein n=1 Tax=Mycobacterium sp. 852002-40037_SCH5390672 TaxID=1834089 RepID=UPI0012E807A8|nr:Mce protein [Mycobacterium sp. 852002-40037_SCH5390672]
MAKWRRNRPLGVTSPSGGEDLGVATADADCAASRDPSAAGSSTDAASDPSNAAGDPTATDGAADKMVSAPQPTSTSDDQTDEPTNESDLVDDESPSAGATEASQQRRRQLRVASLVSVILFAAVAATASWTGYRAYDTHRIEQEQARIVDVARQSALNLANIDWTHVQADVQRIVDSSTGAFLNDFQQRSPAFSDFVHKAQSKSVATIRSAGLESNDGHVAKVIVAMSVDVTAANAPPEQQPRSWRVRLSVQKMPDGGLKISNVEFVP